jgi:hypothetical protein
VEHERAAWAAPLSVAFMPAIERRPPEEPARTNSDARENAEREARMPVEYAEAMERQRVQATLEQQRLQHEMDLRRAEIAKKRPTWMLAVTGFALVAAVGLIFFAVQRKHESDEANAAKERAEERAEDVTKKVVQESKDAQAKVEKLSSDFTDLDKKVNAAVYAVATAQNDADRTAARATLDKLRKEKFEMEQRIQAARAAAAKAEPAK